MEGERLGVCIEQDGTWRDVPDSTRSSFICGFNGRCVCVCVYL